MIWWGSMNDNVEQKNLVEIADIELGSSVARVRARGKFRDKDALDFIPTPESVLLHIDTPNYDGPLDLLLHLIRKHSMDIFDIPIVTITKKYLAALDEMQSLNLDVAGEFLVMAATLAEIKSKMLLPKEEQNEEIFEEDGSDPRHELIRRLLLYKSFKDAGAKLLERPMLGRELFLRPIETIVLDEQEILDQETVELAPIEVFELIDVLVKTLKKSEQQNIHTITRDRISVSARMHELLDYCQIRCKFTFYDALRFFPIYEKVDVIVTFLALLEMSRLKLLKIKFFPDEDLIITVVKENFYKKQKEIFKNIKSAEVVYE
jgi:segregation and condensation protein A